jgi:hypothetical protein
MKTTLCLSAIMLALSGLAGCASTTSDEQQPLLKDQAEARTGSNIPRKTDAKVYDKGAVQDMMRTPSPVGKPGG